MEDLVLMGRNFYDEQRIGVKIKGCNSTLVEQSNNIFDSIAHNLKVKVSESVEGRANSLADAGLTLL